MAPDGLCGGPSRGRPCPISCVCLPTRLRCLTYLLFLLELLSLRVDVCLIHIIAEPNTVSDTQNCSKLTSGSHITTHKDQNQTATCKGENELGFHGAAQIHTISHIQFMARNKVTQKSGHQSESGRLGLESQPLH